MNSDTIEGEATLVHTQALAIRPDEPIRALVTPEEARSQWDAYQRLKAAIADPEDFQLIPGRKGQPDKRFPKKSFVKKIQTYFGVTIRIRSQERDDLGEGHFAFRVIAVAVAPNGREVEASAGCSTLEERFDIQPYDDESESRFEARKRKANARAYHDVLSTAETRASNRAVMNLIGGGEVTAEEVQRQGSGAPQRARASAPKAAPAEAPPHPFKFGCRCLKCTAVQTVHDECDKAGITEKQRKALYERLFAKTTSNDLTIDQLRLVFKEIHDLRKAQEEAK